MTIKHLYPTQRPSLDLNFARTKRLDPRVTFTRGSTATYVGSDRLIKTAADDEARFDHDPETGESLGLLVEEARTNSLTYSGEFDNAAWTKTRTTIVPNAITAPDGTITADKLIRNTDNNINVIYQTVSLAQTTYTFSVFAKQGEYGFCTLVLPVTQGWDADRWISVDLTDGSFAVSSSAPTATTVQECPGGWYRISITHAASAAVTRGGYIDARPSSGFSALPGDGTSGIYIWGAQLEAGAFPTSYIPTDGTPGGIARAADVTSITGSNFSSWYNQDEGTFYSKGDLTYSGSTTFRTILVGGSYPSRRWSWAVVEGIDKLSAATDGMNHTHFYTNMSRNIPNNFNIAQAIKNTATTNVSSAADGVIKGSLTGFSSYTISSILIGHNSFTGHISRLTYYPVRLSDTILQNLTL